MKNIKNLALAFLILSSIILIACKPEEDVSNGKPAADNKTFVEKIENETEKTPETEDIKLKSTYNLTLTYKDNKAILRGALERSTPCVNWAVQISGTKDLPRSQVAIDIFDSNKGAICIQVLGEPQDIYEEITDVSEATEYTAKIEQEVVFKGKLEVNK